MKLVPQSRKAFCITGIYLVLGLLWLVFHDFVSPATAEGSGFPPAAFDWIGILYFLISSIAVFLVSLKILQRHAEDSPRDALISRGHIDLASMAPVGIFSAEKPGEAIYINEQAARLIGLPSGECLGSGWQAAVHEDDRQRVMDEWQQALEKDTSIVTEFRWHHPDGTVVWVIGTASPQYDSSGRIACFMGTLTDISERKAAEAARNEAQQRLQLAVGAARVGLWDWDLRTDRVHFSPEWKSQIGYEDHEIGDSFDEWRSRVHPDDVDRVEGNARKVIEQGSGEIREEFRFRHKDGSWRWILARGSLVHDETGEPVRLLGAHVDITDRKMREIDLQEGLRKYTELAELSPIGIYHADERGGITYVNTTLQKMCGVDSMEELLGDEWMNFLLEADRESITGTWRDILSNPDEYRQEYRLQSKGGRIIWVAEIGQPLFDAAGQLAGFIGTVTDVTPHRETLEELHRSESFRRLIVELEPDCVKVLAPDGGLVEMNPAGLKMIGASSFDSVRGKIMADMVVPEHRDRFVALHKQVMAGGSGRLAFDITGLDGRRRNLETHAVPLREEGRVSGLLGVTRDITEQKQAEKQVRETEIRYRELFESNPIPMCVWDPETLEFLEVNDSMVKHYGYSREELLFMKLTDIRPTGEISRFMDAVEETETSVRTGTHSAGVFRHIRKNGDIMEMDITSHPIRFGDRLTRVSQMTDITEQRRAEAALEQEQAELRETTKRLNHILSTSPTLVFSVRQSKTGMIPIWVSENVERIFGYTREEAMQPEWWMENIHPDDRKRMMEIAASPLETDETDIEEFRFFKKNGEYVWVRVEVRCVGGDEESGIEIVGTWSDITEEHEARERLRLDAAAFESTLDGVIIADSDTRILSVNRALLRTSGYEEEELIGRETSLFKSGRHDEAFFQSMWYYLQHQGYWQGEIWNRRKDGEIYPVWLTISAVHDDHGELTHYVAIYTDISKLKQSEAELHRLAHYDPLTELPNRLLLQSRLEHAIEQAHRRNNLVAVIFLDLDDFKKINDSLGHIVGDELLTEAARRLGQRVRESDTLARLGGDEFVILLETLDQPRDAAGMARDLLAGLSAPFKLPSTHELYVHGSIGISIYPHDGRSPEEMLRAADTAMYRAKEEGGDRFLFFTREMSNEAVANLELENALRNGLTRNEFRLNFQPKIHIDSGQVRSAEALLRWQSEDVGEISPAEFIPVAERSGLIVPIGEWVIDTACAQIADWLAQELPAIHVAVNVSARQFRSPGLVAAVENALKKYHVPPEYLTLELTESMLMDRPTESAGTLEHLKSLGVQCSLDDFGTGFSSLAYLSRFPVDKLKIDGSFVHGIETDPSARQIIIAIIDLAHSLGMNTVAECVETEAQATFLREQGCTILQGYLFSRPLPPGEFAKFVRSYNSQ